MKLAWLMAMALGGMALADSQAEIAAKVNQEGVDLMMKSKYEDAAAKFRDAVARVPEPKYFFNLCAALFQTGRFGEALTACNAVDKNKPTPELHAKTAKLIARIVDEAKAQHIELADAPSDAELAAKLNDEGKELMFASKYDEARAKFQGAITHAPLAIYYFNLCTADFQTGKLGEALEVCNKVATKHPTAAVQTKADKLIQKIRDEAKAQHLKLD